MTDETVERSLGDELRTAHSAAGAVQIYSGADDLCERLGETPLSPSPSSATAFDWAAFSDRA